MTEGPVTAGMVMALHVLGIVAYTLLGETNIGRRRMARMRVVLPRLPGVSDTPGIFCARSRCDGPSRQRFVSVCASTINSLPLCVKT